jgi:hypothetical protein
MYYVIYPGLHVGISKHPLENYFHPRAQLISRHNKPEKTTDVSPTRAISLRKVKRTINMYLFLYMLVEETYPQVSVRFLEN